MAFEARNWQSLFSWEFFYNTVESLLDEIVQVTDSGKETIIDTRTEKEKQLDSDWETEQE